MRSRARILALCGLLLAGAAVAALAAQDAESLVPLGIPFGSAPTVDGVFDAAEWSAAATVGLLANEGTIDVRVHLVHDGEDLYVAFETIANPDDELLIPEILIDVEDDRSEGWSDDDWWFHVSAQNCDARGGYDDYTRCSLTRPSWLGRPNFAPSPRSVPLDAIEIRIPLSMLALMVGETFGLGVTANAWPSDTRGYWPETASIVSPETWGAAVLLEAPSG